MSSDISYEQLEEMIKQLKSSAGSLSKIADGARTRYTGKDKKDDNKTEKTDWDKTHSFSKIAGHAASGLGLLHGNLSVLNTKLGQVIENIPIFGVGLAALATGLFDYTENLVKDWRDMSAVGQNFSGSMFSMASAAQDAGLPLKEFTEFVKANSKAMAVFGQKDISNLAKSVRQAAEGSGLYGYTIAGLNEVTGNYVELQRLMGNKQIKNNGFLANNTAALAKEFSGLAAATGVSRDEIMKITMEAMSSVATTTKYLDGSSWAAQEFAANTTKAVAVLAAVPGEAGTFFANMMATSAGFGNSMFSSQAATLFGAGMGQLVTAMDNYSSRINSGLLDPAEGSAEYLETFKNEVASNLEGLRAQAMIGNKDAESILKYYDQIKTLTKEQLLQKEKDKQIAGGLTAFLTGIGNVFNRLFGSVLTGFFGGLGDIDKKMESFTESPVFKEMLSTMEGAGKSLAAFFNNPEAIKHMATEFTTILNALLNISKTVLVLLPTIIAGAGAIIRIMSAVIGGIAWFANMIFSIGDKINSFIEFTTGFPKWLSGTIEIFLGAVAAFMIKRLFLSDKTIMARNVYVIGGGGLGGGGNPFGGGKGGKAAAMAEKEAMVAAKEGGFLARMAGKAGIFGKIAGGALAVGSMLGGVFHAGGGEKILGDKVTGKAATEVSEKVAEKAATKAAGMGIGKLASRLGGAFIPGVGAAIDGKMAYDAHKDGNDLAAGLYAAGGAVNIAGLGLDGTVLGAPVGVIADVVGGVLSGLGMAAEFTGFGKSKPKSSPKDPSLATADSPELEDGGVGNAGQSSSGDELKKLRELQEQQLSILTQMNKTQSDNLRATREGVKQMY